MKSFLIILFFGLLTNLARSSTSLKKAYQGEFEILNQEIKQELLYGDLSNKSVKESLRARIKKLASLALQIGGRKHRRMVLTSFNKTLFTLASMSKSYQTALDMTYTNGLTGREIVVEALDPENNRRVLEIYTQKKSLLRVRS